MQDDTGRFEQLITNLLGSTEIGSFIDGAVQPGLGVPFRLVDPVRAKPILSYRDAGGPLVDAALQSGRLAQKAWAALTASQRGRTMWEIGRRIRLVQADLAELETRGTGKPIRDTRAEVLRVAEMFEYYGGWCDKLHGEVIPVPSSHLNYTQLEPYGVVVQITPWNAPIFTAGWQIAPAIAAGNAAVLKPSEWTPLTSLALGRICHEAGVPAGLVNVLAGQGSTTGRAAVAHPLTALVVFVGSPETGSRIAAEAARNIVPTILELGGKSANIVFEDADLDRAILGQQAAIFAGAGQSCVAGSRLLVQRSIHDAFVARLASTSARIPVGRPLDEATQIGPIAISPQWDRVKGMVDRAVAGGATLVAGGDRPAALAADPGFWFAPTILTGIERSAEIAAEEVFGPVLGVFPFDSEEEALMLANHTRFGLAGAVWTRDGARGHRVARGLRAGTVWVNGYKTINVMSPFGGFGRSGYGRSSGLPALLAYTQPKSIWVETAAAPPAAFGYAGE